MNETVKTLNFRLKNMSRIGSKLSKDIKLTIVQSYILSKIDYCNSLYSGINQNLVNKLQNILNASARFICRATGTGNNWKRPGTMHHLLFELHLLPVKYRIQYKLALLCFKCIKQCAPSYLSNLISFQTPSSYNLRRNDDIFC